MWSAISIRRLIHYTSSLRPGLVRQLRLPTSFPTNSTGALRFSTATPMADDAPDAGLVERDGKQYRPIKEGKATILVPHDPKSKKTVTEEQQVFYNPIQQYNRDLSTLAIKVYGEWTLEKRLKKLQSRNADKQSKGKKRKRGDEEPAPEAETEPKEPSATEATEAPNFPKPTFKILDALSASGLRAMRYAHELPFITSVTANDLSESAAKSIQVNVDHNGLQDIITVTNQDALALMYRAIADDLSKRDRNGNPGKAHKFDVIDLDPYGTAAPFFDAAIQSVRDDGGLLCITCTDSAVWAGHSYCEKTYALYGGIPLKGMHTHEAALRLILHAVASSGSKYGLSIEPMLSLSIDFYTKVFVKVTRSPHKVKFLGANTMLVYSCDQGCGSWETQPVLRSKPAPNKKGDGFFFKHGMALGPTADRFCRYCGFKMHLAGPMYAGHIHNQEFIQRILDEIPKAPTDVYKTLPRLEGMLRTAQEEYLPGPEPQEGVDCTEAALATPDHTPFFVIPGKVSSIISSTTPNDDMFRGALLHLGYQVGRSHCRPGAIKTDAPWSTIWWIMTEWIRQKSPVKTSKYKPSMAAWKILHDAGIVGHESDSPSKDEQADGDDHKMEGIEEQPAKPKAEEPAEHGNGEAAPGASEAPKSEEAETPLPSEDELRKTLVFNDALARLGRTKLGQRYVRYQMNPSTNWGPMTRAKGN
ncbi:hypothetical protein Purlil1_5298 [Purpureocillium lilacinum]|uniref:tRNA (guanine(26)-N(2))-dimethyltransferase n=2 Tax=Purpureocillium lilacinum TaxID=33203 RepID=A0ABR0C1I3_PURLI|nr:hypothetical protein Purlil1_5298 [Purpureocillium lilacinum]